MPSYNYHCRACDKDFIAAKCIAKRSHGHCPDCGKRGKKEFTVSRVMVWEPMVYEHITSQPLYIETKQQLKDACKKYGVRAARLE